MTVSTATFDIRNFLDAITPTKNKNRYICPVCGNNNLTIDPKDGAYTCWNECQRRDIREAIAPRTPKNQFPRTAPQPKRKPAKAPTPVPIPVGEITLAKFPNPVESPARVNKGLRTEITYPYSATQWVLRVEDPEGKATYPYHTSSDGKPTKGKGNDLWEPYRKDEVRSHGSGKWVLGVEGEKCVEAGRRLGLVSWTLQGGSWGETALIQAMQFMKDAAVAGVVYFPDHDDIGYTKAKKLASAADKVGLPFIEIDPARLWEECPKKGDIADWVKEPMNTDEFIQRLEAEIHEAVEERRLLIKSFSERFAEQESQTRFEPERTIEKTKHQKAFDMVYAAWGHRLRWNTLKKVVELDGERLPLDRLRTKIALAISLDLTPHDAREVVLEIALSRPYNPVLEYLQGVSAAHPNVDTGILDAIAPIYFGTNEKLHSALIKRTLIAAVARAFKPGCKYDTICILQGEQGSFKSTFWETLASRKFFTDDISSGSEKDEQMKLSQYWILEYAEFENAYRKKEVSNLKAFLSRTSESFRRPYGTDVEDFPRPSIFVGTTNKSEFLHDPTGERRYWVIPIMHRKIPVERLKTERDLIWAAAVKLYQQGEQWWLTREEDEWLQAANGQYQSTDSWESVIENYLLSRSFVRISDLLIEALRFEVSKCDRASEMRVAEILRRLGWQKAAKQRRVNGKPSWVWEPPMPSQPIGSNDVVTEVVTSSNIDEAMVSPSLSLPSLPLTEHYNAVGHNENFCETSTEVIQKSSSVETKVVGCDETPITIEQQHLEPVTTSVTSAVTTSDNSVLGSAQLIKDAILEVDGVIIEAIAEGWTDDLKQAVAERLTPEDKKAVYALAPKTFPSLAVKPPVPSFVVGDVVSVLDYPKLKGKTATVSTITKTGIWVRVNGAIAPFGEFQPEQLRK